MYYEMQEWIILRKKQKKGKKTSMLISTFLKKNI